MTTIYEEKTNLGNNETATKRGIYQEVDGSFLALTMTRSKTFKTLRGAKNFLGLA